MGRYGSFEAADALTDAAAGGPQASGELMRLVAYGEAVRAIWAYLDIRMLDPTTASTLALLDDAYARMSRQRSAFSPEDFAVYALSRALERIEDDDDAQRLRLGAARYLLDVEAFLAPDLRALADDARRVLAQAGIAAVSPASARRFVCLSDGNTVKAPLSLAVPALAPSAPARTSPPRADTAAVPRPDPGIARQRDGRMPARTGRHEWSRRGRPSAGVATIGLLVSLALAVGLLSALILMTGAA